MEGGGTCISLAVAELYCGKVLHFFHRVCLIEKYVRFFPINEVAELLLSLVPR